MTWWLSRYRHCAGGNWTGDQKSFLRRKLKMWIKACSRFFKIYLSLSGPVQSRMEELRGKGASNQEVIESIITVEKCNRESRPEVFPCFPFILVMAHCRPWSEFWICDSLWQLWSDNRFFSYIGFVILKRQVINLTKNCAFLSKVIVSKLIWTKPSKTLWETIVSF